MEGMRRCGPKYSLAVFNVLPTLMFRGSSAAALVCIEFSTALLQTLSCGEQNRSNKTQMRRIMCGSQSLFAGATQTRAQRRKIERRWHDGLQFATSS